MSYLNWKEEKIIDESSETINRMYDNGFVFTRIAKGIMQQTRSVRIDLSKFELSSENRRILRKGETIMMEIHNIPFSKYTWGIGKVAKDFYDKKAPGSFSVNKIKEIMTTGHNFNTLFTFGDTGYCIAYQDTSILHYCYPFYDLEKSPKDMGLIMMTKVIAEAQMKGHRYVYLGSLQRPSDVYKLQFSGIEWFDGEKWKTDIEEVKEILEG
jgi:arginyl-tRNA--protein-N-Asp/Glu arginylyltransferase